MLVVHVNNARGIPNQIESIGMLSTAARSTSQSELGSGLWGQFKVSTDRDGGGEFDGIVYMSVVALQERSLGCEMEDVYLL